MMNRAVFLDRDGVINKEIDYAHKIEDFVLLPNVIEALKLLTETDYKIIVVSNQAGIAKGIHSKQDADKLFAYMKKILSEKGIRIDAVHYCPHHPDDGCECRKPNIGMLKKAEKEFDIDLSKSFIIGDKTSDIKAGENAGCTTILVKTGYGGKDGKNKAKPDFVADDLMEAVKIILSDKIRGK